jgi:hypothetical protein
VLDAEPTSPVAEADIALADLADSETREEWLARSYGPEPEYDPDLEREVS